LGIVFVQGYWISNAYQTKTDQFTINVKQALLSVTREIQLQENEAYYQIYSSYVDSIQVPNNAIFTELAYRIQNEATNETYIFTDGILEQDYKLSTGVLNTNTDSVQFTKLTNRKTKTKISQSLDGVTTADTRVESFSRMKDYERKQFENFVGNVTALIPIYKRVEAGRIAELLTKELKERGLNSKFEFAIYSNNFETKVRSKNFKYSEKNTYVTPLFANEAKNGYELYVNFSAKKKLVLNSILGMAILALVFTAVIILAYSSANSHIYKQRQIPQIKIEFINNMTHEFKTPIATINLALDSLKNPKVKDNREFLDRYLGMIREENKRMHAQVENVLRI